VELIDAKGRSAQYSFPSKWEECTVAQLGSIAALMSAGLANAKDDERSAAHLRLRLLHELTGMSDAEFAELEVSDLLSLQADDLGVDRVALLPQLAWAMEEPRWHESMVPELTVQGVVWKGPEDRLKNFSLKRWGLTDGLLQRFASAEASEKDLNNLLGCLYHRADEPWNNEDVEERGAHLGEHVADRAKLAMVLNYRGLRSWFAAYYPKCFKGGEADTRGILGMVVRLAGPKFGDVLATENTGIHYVMIHVEQSIEEAERLKAQH
jgi:hypothetical protein